MYHWILGVVVAVLGTVATVAYGETGFPGEQDRDARDSQGIPQVLTPARLRQPRSETPASVTVIDRELIEATGARELYDLMKLVPGMSAVKVDGNVPTVSYHGTMARDDRRMLVLIDGRSVYRPGLARVVWNDLPISVDDVSRIEVTRGPNSASYGANAFSGVINIITRHSRNVSTTTAETRQGNNGVGDNRLTSGGDQGRSSWRYTLEQQHDDGYDDGFDPEYDHQLYRDSKTMNRANVRAAVDLSPSDSIEVLAGGSSTSLQRPPDDDFRDFASYRDYPDDLNENLFGQLRWQHDFSPQHSMKVSAYSQYSDSRQEMGLCMNPFPPPPPGAERSEVPALGVTGVYFSKELRDVYLGTGRNQSQTEDILAASIYYPSSAAANQSLVDRIDVLEDRNNPDAPEASLFCGDFAFDVVEKRHDLEIENTIHFGDRAKLVAGLNWRHDRGHSDTYTSGTAENFSRRAFGTLEVEVFEPLLVNLGGFWEKDDINGEFFNPRGAVVVKPAQGHSLRAVYSEAVRTSDLYEAEARTNLTAENLMPPYEAATDELLGWNTPHFFITQQSPGNLQAEEIESRELGYYGRFGPLEVDIRHFRERMRNLISRALNPFAFNARDRDRVDLRGWETQLSWRPTPDHLLRLTNAHIHNDSSINVEERLSPRDSGSFLWRYDLSRRWMVSSAYYLAHHYNRDGTSSELRPFERLDLVLAHRRPIGTSRLRLEGRFQHDLRDGDEPVVFQENRYEDHNRFQVSLSLEF